MAQRRIALLINPTSGKGRGGQNAPIAARRLRERGLDVIELQGNSATESLQLAHDAVARGIDGLVACGGDGTVHLATQAVAEKNIPLGVIPVGTGDDNARSLRLPLKDVAAAADVIADGRTRTVDLGQVTAADGTKRFFVGVLSVGFDSEVNERANTMTWPHGQLRYLVAIVAQLRVFRPVPFTIGLDGKPVDTSEQMLVAVGNGRSYGGGMMVCPQAQMDDGLLDLTELTAISKLTFLRAFPSVFKGTHTRYPYVRTSQAKVIDIDAAGQIVYADGERIGPAPAHIEVRPGSLHTFAATN